MCFSILAGPATEKFPVVVTSYEIVIADSKLLQRYKWKYVIVDEGHRLKNFNCKLLRELRQIPVDNKLLLTGMTVSVSSGLLLHQVSLLLDYKILWLLHSQPTRPKLPKSPMIAWLTTESCIH